MTDVVVGVYRFDSVNAIRTMNAHGCRKDIGSMGERMIRGETFAVERYEDPSYLVIFEDGERGKMFLEFIQVSAVRLGWTVEDWMVIAGTIASDRAERIVVEGKYSIIGYLYTPNRMRITFGTDLSDERGAAFIKMLEDQRGESVDEPEPVQIPATLEEAIAALEGMASKADEFMQSLVGLDPGEQEERFVTWAHHGLGQWMRNTWGLWSGSPLQTALVELGLDHADDMSGLILTCFIRRKFGRPLDIARQVKFYQDYWAKQRAGSDGE